MARSPAFGLAVYAATPTPCPRIEAVVSRHGLNAGVWCSLDMFAAP
jgi:hypothetical protein